MSTFASNNVPGVLCRDDAALYLDRLSLPRDLLDNSSPSLNLLSNLQCAHLVSIPFDTSAIHVAEPEGWSAPPETPIRLLGGRGVKLAGDAFERIVKQRRGGYCFSMNSTFAALLRFFGFRVSECAARVFAFLGKDPEETGFDWTQTSHEVLIVDWPDSQGRRYHVDIGFGSSMQPYRPIPLEPEVENEAMVPTFAHRFIKGPLPLPESFSSASIDRPDYWQLQVRLPARSVPSHNDTSSSRASFFWTPIYAFTLASVSFKDFVQMNYFNSGHPDQPAFTRFFVVSLALDEREGGSGRRTLSYREDDGSHRKGWARYEEKREGGSGGGGEAVETREVAFEIGPIGEVLCDKFGFSREAMQLQ